ncbi:MAG: hypothetical protein J0L55_04540 [Caulobacterales bacterium]|nr:hypothetical protein [Caulobacterales bacterium]MCA0372883.1 hypothetical protein [Pseudomonadota bacterium]
MKNFNKLKIATVVGISSFILSSCGEPYEETQYQYRACADANDWRIDDEECDNPSKNKHAGSHYVFFSNSSNYYPGIGQKVSGASSSPVGDAAIATIPTHGMRGGFGASGHSYSSHGGIS